MGVVHQSIQDGISDGFVTDDVVPDGAGKLAGDDVGFALTGFEQFEDASILALFDLSKTPIVDQQYIGTAQLAQVFAQVAADFGIKQVTEELGCVQVEYFESIHTGFSGNGAGKPGFAQASGSSEDDILAVADPIGIGKALDNRAFEVSV